MKVDENKPNTYGETFLNKLKEQSFTIILLVGIMYYQNLLFTKQMEEYKKAIDKKEELLLKLTDDERNRLIEREKYLIQQRDMFLDDLRELRKKKKDKLVMEKDKMTNKLLFGTIWFWVLLTLLLFILNGCKHEPINPCSFDTVKYKTNSHLNVNLTYSPNFK